VGGHGREVEEPAADVATGGEEVAAAAGGRVEEHLGRADGEFGWVCSVLMP